MYIIKFKNSKTVVDELKYLSKVPSFKSSIEEEVSEKVKRKTKKKKNKKKKKKDSLGELFENRVPSQPLCSLDDYVDLLQNEDDDEDIDIAGEQGRGYDKLKKGEDTYKKEFAEELTLLYKLLNESNAFNNKLEKKFDALDAGKVRGTTKFSNDLALSIISIKGNRLSILKEIASIKRNILDLKLKEKKGTSDESSTSDKLASSYLRGILSHGRHSFVKALTGSERHDDENNDSYDDEDIVSAELNEYEKDHFDSIIERRISEEGNQNRSREGDLYIEMETLGIKTMIEKNIENGEWKFINVDRNKQKINGYPLPDRNRVKKVKFSDDGRYATDDFNGIYPVIEIC